MILKPIFKTYIGWHRQIAAHQSITANCYWYVLAAIDWQAATCLYHHNYNIGIPAGILYLQDELHAEMLYNSLDYVVF